MPVLLSQKLNNAVKKELGGFAINQMVNFPDSRLPVYTLMEL